MAPRSSGSGTPASVPGSDAWQIVPELGPDDAEPHIDKDYGDAFEDDVPRVGPVRPRRRAALRRRREHRCVRPLDDPRRVRPWLRHDPRQRRAHDGRQDRVGSAAPGPGHRPHEHVLDPPEGAGPDSRNGGRPTTSTSAAASADLPPSVDPPRAPWASGGTTPGAAAARPGSRRPARPTRAVRAAPHGRP